MNFMLINGEESHDCMYMQMEYCERETLRHLIDSGELQKSDDRVWRLFREIVEGLEHIHSKVSHSGILQFYSYLRALLYYCLILRPIPSISIP